MNIQFVRFKELILTAGSAMSILSCLADDRSQMWLEARVWFQTPMSLQVLPKIPETLTNPIRSSRIQVKWLIIWIFY